MDKKGDCENNFGNKWPATDSIYLSQELQLRLQTWNSGYYHLKASVGSWNILTELYKLDGWTFLLQAASDGKCEQQLNSHFTGKLF